ncbi:rhodanese-like domain-containing protein [Vibrio variabilis]|uniref:rhodanese-like domain-containing protein n=1 Tax=Vibrio variabilis TaxID=990271 RepID=UPI000DD957C8|nr:rhodanese-like domain-containing protein [Vibrio variabilis]
MNSTVQTNTTLNDNTTGGTESSAAKQYLIDVRSPQEFASGHIEGSLNVPLQMIFAVANSDIQPQDNLVVYCASGMRASQAVQVLESMGYRNIVNAGTVSAASDYISR